MPSHAVSRAPASTRLQAPWHTPPAASKGKGGGCGRETQTGSSVTIWHPQGDVPSLVGSRAAPIQKGRDKNNTSRCGRPPITLAQGRVLTWWHPELPKAWPPAGERDRHHKGLTDGHEGAHQAKSSGNLSHRPRAHEPSMRGAETVQSKMRQVADSTLCMRQSVQWANMASNNLASHRAGKGKLYRRRQRW